MSLLLSLLMFAQPAADQQSAQRSIEAPRQRQALERQVACTIDVAQRYARLLGDPADLLAIAADMECSRFDRQVRQDITDDLTATGINRVEVARQVDELLEDIRKQRRSTAIAAVIRTRYEMAAEATATAPAEVAAEPFAEATTEAPAEESWPAPR